MNKYGEFQNPEGYTLIKVRDDHSGLIGTIAIYEFTLDYLEPLTFCYPDGGKIQPDQHLAETDLGSVPRWIQPLIPKDRFLLSFLMHDSGYKHHGLYVAGKGGGKFMFQPMTRQQVDELLRQWVGAEGGNWLQRSLIYRAVRLGGGSPWRQASAKP